MKYSDYKSNTPITLLVVITTFSFALSACGDDPTDDDSNDPTQEHQIEGTTSNYEHDTSSELYFISTNFDNDATEYVGEGNIEADGSFTFTFYGLDEIEEVLEPAGEDNFRGFFCMEQIQQEFDSDNLFLQVPYINFLGGEDDNLSYLGLASGEVDITHPYPLSHNTEHQVRWFFSNEALSLSADCGERSIDLNLNAGWNEVNYDLSDSENHLQYTGSHPDDVEWKIDELD